MVVGRRLAGAGVDVCQDLEAEPRVLVEQVDAALGVGAAIARHETGLAEQPLEVAADPLAPRRARVGVEVAPAVFAEALERVGHVRIPSPLCRMGCYPRTPGAGAPRGTAEEKPP